MGNYPKKQATCLALYEELDLLILFFSILFLCSVHYSAQSLQVLYILYIILLVYACLCSYSTGKFIYFLSSQTQARKGI